MTEPTFALIGEPLALDLVNTRPNSREGRVDLLADVRSLRAWLAVQEARLPAVGGGRVTGAELAAVRAVRDDVAAAVDAVRGGDRPPRAVVESLNAAQRSAPVVRELVWGRTGPAVRARRLGSFADRLAGGLAEAAVDLLADPRLGSVRRCEAEDCVLLFLPAHPNRRWCSADRCGNRVRVARYYRRHRGDRAEP